MLLSPKTSRTLFEHFKTFDSDTGLNRLLDDLCLDKTFIDLVRSDNVITQPFDSSFRIELHEFIKSHKFQKYIIPRILNSYPEKGRLFFVHLPKCLGSDLTLNLASRLPNINFRMAEQHWMTSESFLNELKRVVVKLDFGSQVFIHGHIPLGWWLGCDLHRPQDLIFTVMRNPIDIVLSKINYVIQRFTDDPDCYWPDTKDFLRILGLSQITKQCLERETMSLCRNMLRNPDITHANVMCRFLGDGTYVSALANLIAGNVEVATVDTYRRWKIERWRVKRQTRANVSTKFIGLHHLSAEDLAYIDHINTEDRQLFEHVRTSIWLGREPAVRGRALAETAL